MTLIKFHLGFSILCLITMLYLEICFYDKERKAKLQAAGFETYNTLSEKILNSIKVIIGCFIPGCNVMLVIATYLLCFADVDKLAKLHKEKKDD